MKRQCGLLGISKATYYYSPGTEKESRDVSDLKLILATLQKIPFYGYRKISIQLLADHPHMSRKRVRRIMKRFGLMAIYAKRSLSKACKQHKRYPYLLEGKIVRHPNHVWASDITYLSLPGGKVYLVVILDLYSRKVLSWRLSNALDALFCIDALEEAISLYGEPAIFNTDQGSQYTSDKFISVLKSHHIKISMDGRGRVFDNIYIERLWRSLKYEDIYLKSYESMKELTDGIKKYFLFYNRERFHQSHDYLTPEIMHMSFVRQEELCNAA